MQLEVCLPDSWWEFAFATATHVYNHTPIKCLKWKTPQKIFTGEKPKISHLHVFGCGAYVYLANKVHANKLTPCSELMIFIGYEDNGYRFICHTQENVIFCSTQAIFDERHFPRCPPSHPREQTLLHWWGSKGLITKQRWKQSQRDEISKLLLNCALNK